MTTTTGPLAIKGHLFFLPEGQELPDVIDLGPVEIPVEVRFGSAVQPPQIQYRGDSTRANGTHPGVARMLERHEGRPAYGHPDAPLFPGPPERYEGEVPPFVSQRRRGVQGTETWGVLDVQAQQFSPVFGGASRGDSLGLAAKLSDGDVKATGCSWYKLIEYPTLLSYPRQSHGSATTAADDADDLPEG